MSRLALADLTPVTPQAAQRYAEHANVMASLVSQRLAAHPRLDDFLNGNPFRLLEVNHRHHGAFIAEVLRTNHLDVLAHILPWAYHAYHHQGVPYDYFAVELALWKDVIQEQLPAADAASLLPLYDWMLNTHAATVYAAEHYRAARPAVPDDLHEDYALIVAGLLSGDHVAVLNQCQVQLDSGMPFTRLLQWLFYPAMVEVGARWERGEVSVAMEHQATTLAYLVLSTLYYAQPFPAEKRGNALVASVTNEFHELGAWMVATCLELDGWDVRFLSSDCDAETLLRAAREQPPHLIALSITLTSNLYAARNIVAELRTALGPESRTRIVVGGRALLTAPSLVESIGADLFLTDCEAVVSWARMLDIST